jgi:hypothetical protein
MTEQLEKFVKFLDEKGLLRWYYFEETGENSIKSIVEEFLSQTLAKENPKLEFEKGKFYMTRAGEVVEVILVNNLLPMPIIISYGIGAIQRRNADGSYLSDGTECLHDLVSEYVPAK